MKMFNQIFQKANQSLFFAAQSFKCKVCGEYHQGIKSKNVCMDCYSKGHR